MDPVDELNLKLGIGPRRPPLPSELMSRGYKGIKQVGKGAFGTANLIFNERTGTYYIAKEVNIGGMTDKQKAEVQNEIDILSSLDHPNIVKYEESLSATKVYIIMEYADGGDLGVSIRTKKALASPFSHSEAVFLFGQTALALKYLHERKILHRDLKPQNVFLTKSGIVKLGDFGISTVLHSTLMMAKTICGTPFFFSPELCQGQAYNNKSDIWALGCLLFELLSLDVPFRGVNMTDLMKKIVSDSTPNLPYYCDKRWGELIGQMLQKDPSKRPTIKEIVSTTFLKEQFDSAATDFDKKADDIANGGSPVPSPTNGRRRSTPGFGRRSPRHEDKVGDKPAALPPKPVVAGRRESQLQSLSAYHDDPSIQKAVASLDKVIAVGEKKQINSSPAVPKRIIEVLPSQPFDPIQVSTQCRSIASIFRQIEERPVSEITSPLLVSHIKGIEEVAKTKEESSSVEEPLDKTSFSDNWCSGLDLTVADVQHVDESNVRVGSETFSVSIKRKHSSSEQEEPVDDATTLSQLENAQHEIKELCGSLSEEKGRASRLQMQLDELREKFLALTQENLTLRRTIKQNST